MMDVVGPAARSSLPRVLGRYRLPVGTALNKWTNDPHKNELIRTTGDQLPAPPTRSWDAEVKRKRFDLYHWRTRLPLGHQCRSRKVYGGQKAQDTGGRQNGRAPR